MFFRRKATSASGPFRIRFGAHLRARITIIGPPLLGKFRDFRAATGQVQRMNGVHRDRGNAVLHGGLPDGVLDHRKPRGTRWAFGL